MEQFLRDLKNKVPYFNYYNETREIVSKVNKFLPNKDVRILDVGCGRGRNIEALKSAGYTKIIGIDKNPETVALNREKGYTCVMVDSLKRDEKFDLIIFSHIIEHFTPNDMVVFIDSYLDFLNINGFALIATPIISPFFYSDLDHIKPCYPLPLLRIFGKNKDEVQGYSRNKIIYKDIWVFRSPIDFFPYLWLLCIELNPIQKAIQFISKVLFYLSHGIIGYNKGWVGIFQKVDD